MTNRATANAGTLMAAGQTDPDQIKALSTTYGINQAFLVATWMTVAALVLAFFIKKVRPAEEPIAAQARK